MRSNKGAISFSAEQKYKISKERPLFHPIGRKSGLLGRDACGFRFFYMYFLIVLIHFFTQGECVLEGEFLIKKAADLTYQKAVERRTDERSDVYSVKAAKEEKR